MVSSEMIRLVLCGRDGEPTITSQDGRDPGFRDLHLWSDLQLYRAHHAIAATSELGYQDRSVVGRFVAGMPRDSHTRSDSSKQVCSLEVCVPSASSSSGSLSPKQVHTMSSMVDLSGTDLAFWSYVLISSKAVPLPSSTRCSRPRCPHVSLASM